MRYARDKYMDTWNTKNNNNAEHYYNHVINVGEHMTLDQLVSYGYLTESFVKESRIFCVIRDPVERFISAINHIVNIDRPGFERNIGFSDPIAAINFIYEQFKDHSFFWSQCEWVKFNNVMVVDSYRFNNRGGMVRDIFNYLNIPETTPIQYHHRVENSVFTRDNLPKVWYNRVISLYRDDIEMYQSLQ
jgi:hypothetical protein